MDERGMECYKKSTGSQTNLKKDQVEIAVSDQNKGHVETTSVTNQDYTALKNELDSLKENFN